jgi:signal transduction histidine kinase
MTNLVGNGVKFTERGKIEVSVECPAWTASDAMMRVEVKDTGIGIAPDKLELIFEKFTQADGSMTRRYGGTGLGLSIVKQLVDLMGGAIAVKSELGQGSIFAVTFRLPLAANSESAAASTEADRSLTEV